MDEIVDLNAERNKRAQPDPEFVKHDDYGRPMYHFGLGYEFEGSEWSCHIWAYSMEDAEARIAAMRASLRLFGQTFSMIPA